MSLPMALEERISPALSEEYIHGETFILLKRDLRIFDDLIFLALTIFISMFIY